MDLDLLLRSIEHLSPMTKPRWGVMNPSQMLKHCNRHTKMYCSGRKTGFFGNLLTLTLGKGHLIYIKYIVRYDINRYAKNSYTPKFLRTSELKDLDFDHEKKRLIQQLNFVFQYDKDFMINPMHGKVKKDTFKRNINAHISYHLNQFGVLQKNTR